MKINTDLIKNKKFTFPIDATLLKRSQEYRVLATLRHLYPNSFEAMTTGESPDLQDSMNEMGIEVTCAVAENDMRASRAFSQLHQELLLNSQKHLKTILSSGHSVIHLKGKNIAISTAGTSDGEKYIFQEAIRRKLKKLGQYQAKFKKVGLAIILPEIPTSYAENHFHEWVVEIFKNSEIVFDFFFVISHRFCICVEDSAFEKRAITSDEHKLLSTIARMTAEGELSLTSTEWL